MRKTSFLLHHFPPIKVANEPTALRGVARIERGSEDRLPVLVDAAAATDRRQITISGRKKTSVLGSAAVVKRRKKGERWIVARLDVLPRSRATSGRWHEIEFRDKLTAPFTDSIEC